LGDFGELRGRRLFLIPQGMKKANFPNLRNRKSDSSFSSFLEEENLRRNWEL
jgi:hypothetical protein